MVTSSDFIPLPYSDDLTRGGIAYASKSLRYTYNRMGSSALPRLRRIVAGIAVELAFRRYLAQEEIPHDNLGRTPFTDPDRYDIAIGGRRCDIKSFVLKRKKSIRLIRQEPEQLLQAEALVPVDQSMSTPLRDTDLYIFAFLTALLTPNQDLLQKAIAAKQPIHLIYPFPKKWSRRDQTPLGDLVLKSAASQTLRVKLIGQGQDQAALSEEVTLQPGKRTKARRTFRALSHIHTPTLPDDLIGIHSPLLDETEVIKPIEWGNIWVYGMEIIFTGYISRGEFRQQACTIPAGSRVFQYPRTSTDNLSIPTQNLKPLAQLFGQAKDWERQ